MAVLRLFKAVSSRCVGIDFVLAGSSVSAAASDSITIAQGNDTHSLDPANHGSDSTESALIIICDDLMSKDFSQGQLRFTPRLAASWETNDHAYRTFRLRDDVCCRGSTT